MKERVTERLARGREGDRKLSPVFSVVKKKKGFATPIANQIDNHEWINPFNISTRQSTDLRTDRIALATVIGGQARRNTEQIIRGRRKSDR